MRVSLVINTLNRCDMLRHTLESLPQQRYRDFEVIVVNGPSSDGTAELLSSWCDCIKVADCPQANLAVSRNIGVRQAAGDIVAFIDDDAVPDPCWLERIVAGYDHPKIGAVGGFVLDRSGFEFQTTYIVADRFGGATTHNPIDPTAEFNTPGAPRYAAHLGTNTTVRRSLLLALGGFDEEFDYYLDETDLCLRIVDSGHVVKYVANALVYHKFAASHLRNSDEVLLKRYPVLKNQSYFAIKHGAAAHGFVPAFESIVAFFEHHRREVRQLVDRGAMPASAIADFELEASNAIRDGVTRAIAAASTDLVSIAPDPEAAVFKTFPRRNVAPDQITICLLAERNDSVAVADLAEALAGLGHTVHRLSATATTNTVTLEQGVWVHRLAPVSGSSLLAPDISQTLWQRSWTLMDQLRRIAANDRVDVVQVASTACVATAALIEGTFPIVVTVDRPLAVLACADLGWISHPSELHDELIPSLWWERWAVLFADGISAASIETIERFEQLYELAIDRERVAVVPEADRRRASLAALALFRRVIAETPPARWRSNGSALHEGFSRRCTLSEFWVTATLFPTLRAVAGGAVDWRAWARSLVLQNLAASAAKRVVVFVDEPLPAACPQVEIEQIVAAPGELDAAVRSLRDSERIYDAVYCIPLVDPYDPSSCDTVAMLGDVCRAGGAVHLIVGGGEVEGSFASIGQALAGHGLVPEPGWTALLLGAPQPAFAEPDVEPYLQATIDGVARPIAAIALRKLGVAVPVIPALAGLDV